MRRACSSIEKAFENHRAMQMPINQYQRNYKTPKEGKQGKTYPVSICFATLNPAARFSVKMAEESPYSVSFATAMASSSVLKVKRATVGPKDSV